MNDKTDISKNNGNTEHRQYLNEISERNLRNFDKTIIALSSGALAISLVFIEKIIGSNDIGCLSIIILALAWFFYLFAIIINLWSNLTGSQECIDEIKRIDNGDEENTSNNKTNLLNILALIFFVFGTILLLLFSLINIYGNQVL